MRVTFWGTRGSLAKPGPETVRYGGNTSCVQVVTRAGTLVVLDCGTGAHALGQQLTAGDGAVQGHILISHTHWDHIQGLPFFAPLFAPGHSWDVWGPRGLGDSLQTTLAGQMQYTYFPVTLEALRADVRYHDLLEGSFRLGEVEVRTRYLNHPALALAFRLEADGASMVYVCDHEPHAPEIAAGRGPLVGQDRAHADFLSEADLVIHDAQYTAQEYASKVGWGHSTLEYAVRVCREANVRRLALTHHDPLRTDDALDDLMEDLLAEHGADFEFFAAREGQVIEVEGVIAPERRASAGTLTSPPAERSVTPVHATALLALSDSPEARLLAEALEADGIGRVTCEGAHPPVCYEAEEPGLVILGGGEAGLEACREIRALGGAAAEVPVLLIGRTTGEVPGPGEWLRPPFTAEYARSRIRAWLLRVESRWKRAAEPPGERERLAALRRLAVLDTEPDERFDRLARLAAGLLGAPISLVSLVDHDRQWFKSRVGLGVEETSRDESFCAHVILGQDAMVVPDALEDDRFAHNPLVVGPPHVRFYAGCPLTLPDGNTLGTLCVLDTRPRQLSAEQRGLLRDLADLVEEELARS